MATTLDMCRRRLSPSRHAVINLIICELTCRSNSSSDIIKAGAKSPGTERGDRGGGGGDGREMLPAISTYTGTHLPPEHCVKHIQRFGENII